MDAISHSILLQQKGRYIAIVKDSVPRMAFSVAHSPYILLIHLQGGRDQAWMLKYITFDLIVPLGYYLLAEAGFPHCKELLIPYQGKCYHLQEWGRANLKPVD